MTKSLLATVLAATLALTSIAPTQAVAGPRENEALAKFLVGAITLYALSEAIKDDRKSTRQHTVQPQKPRHKVHNRHHRRHLPVSCLRTHRVSDGKVTVFGRKCLRNNYRYVNRLPDQCERKLWTAKGIRHGYARKCLRRNGFHWNT